jgi:hypothetical protein
MSQSNRRIANARGGGHVSLVVHAELAARIEQPVHLPVVATLFPKGRLPATRRGAHPKSPALQAQLLPQLARQPAATEQTRAPQLETAQFQMVFYDAEVATILAILLRTDAL